MGGVRSSALLVLVVVLFAGGLDPVAAAPAGEAAAPAVGDASKVAPLVSPAPAAVQSVVSSGDFSFAPPLAGGEMPVIEGPGKGFSKEKSRAVAGEQTASSETFTNPDGSKTLQAAVDPVRFQDDTGTWHDIDTGLTTAKDGSLVPKSVEDPIVIPKDPTDGLVMIPTTAGTITLDRVAGADLAAPRLVDDPATMSAGKVARFSSDAGDVLVRARRDGFEQDLVFASVKQAEAAYRLVFEVPAGVTARTGGSGVEFVAADGEVVGEFGGGLASDSKIDKTSGLGAETSVKSRLVGQADGTVTVEVSVSEEWLSDPDRVFPVTVDPVWSHNTSMGGLQGFDTFVKSDLSSSQFSATELRAGTADSGYTDSRSLVYFGLDGLPTGVGIASAKLKLYQTYASTCTATQLDVYGVGAGWNSSTVWSNAPTSDGYGPRATPSFSSGISGSCPSAWVDVDVTDLVREWYAGTTPDLGVYLVAHDETANSNYKRFASGDAGASTAPALEITYSNPPAQSNPTGSTLVDNYVIATTTPTLTTSTATDPDGDTVWYWYQVSSGATPDSGSIVAQSGLISSPSWMVPAGSLQDGGVYSWTVWTFDGTVFKKADWSRRFRVNLRIGDGGPSPKDTLGPFTVNLGNGNISTGFSSPSFPTVAGSLGVSYAYSSKTPSPYGITATYWQTKDLSGPSGGQRRETSLTAAVESDKAPMPGMWPGTYSARYQGLFVPPESGNYTFGVKSDDGVRVWVNNVLVIDDWHDHPVQMLPLWATTTVTLPQSVAVPIKVEYYNNGGRGSIEVWMKSTATGGGAPVAQQPIPSSALRVTDALMPAGWTMSPDTDGTLEFVRASMVGNSVVFNDSSGGVHTWSWSGSGYVPLGGEEGTVTKNSDGTVRFEGSDGQVYLFRTDGSLDSVFNTADIKKPAAPIYTYEGSPARLTKVTDRVSGKAIKITYQGIGSVSTGTCATAPSGFDATPPTGMPCLVDYADFGAGQTKLYYSAGRLARVVDPGDATVGYPTSDFGYDTDSVLTTVRSPLANDMIAAGVRATTDLNESTVIYGSNHMPSAVYLPAVNSGTSAARIGRTYFEGWGISYVNTAPTAADGTHYTTKVTFDDGLRQLSTSDERSIGNPDPSKFTTTVVWNTTADIPIRTTDPAGTTTTTILDSRNWPTDSYGPAPDTWFQTSGLPTTAHSGDVPHSQTFYDEGIKGLAANYWDNATFTGVPKSYDTGVGDSTGKLTKSWGSAAPNGLTSASNWSARYTGDITFPETGTYTLKVATAEQQGVGLTVDGQHIIDANAPLSQIAVLGDSAGAKQLFARGANNELVWKYYSTTGTPGWSNWISLGGTLTSAPTAVTLFGSTDVYVRGTDNGLWTKHFDYFAGTWGAWTSVAGPALAGAPAAVISNSQTHVFARAASNDSLMHYYKSGTTWANENLGGTIVGDPATTAPTSTRPDVYARGTNNHLYHRFWNGSSWAAWEDLGGTMNSSPAASSSSQMHVFYRSASNTLTHVWVNSLTPPWYSEDLGGTITTAPGVQQTGTRIDVIAQGSDNAIYQKSYTTSWQTWASLGTSFRAGTYTVTSDRQNKPVPISIDLTQSSGTTSIDLRWCAPSTTCTGEVSVPGDKLNARYGLVTRTIDADGHTTTTEYDDPALGLVTKTHVDPSGLNLISSNTFETAGTGYYRQTSYRLPKDNGTTTTDTQVDKTYWGDTDTNPGGTNSAAADCGTTAGVNQAGMLKTRQGATPSSGHGANNRVTDEYVYDLAGRTVAHKASGDAHWECTHYDARGRVSSTTDSSSAQRTSTSSYAFDTAGTLAR